MCIIIFKPENKEICDDYLQASYDMNPDGIGYSFVVGEGDGAKIITKHFMKFNKFMKQYRKDEENNMDSTPFLIHFRACSKGVVNIENCHPFKINEGQVFAHNGTIYGIPEDKDNKKSDTWMFNNAILKNLPFQWESNAGIRCLIRATLGQRNKVVVLNKTKEFIIFGEHLGVWDNGIWYSNEHYLNTYVRNTQGVPVLKSEYYKPANSHWDKWEEEQLKYWESGGYIEPEKSNDKQGKIFGQNSAFAKDVEEDMSHAKQARKNEALTFEDSCEFCGMSMEKEYSVRNLEFDDLYKLCSYCANTLTSFGGLAYVN